jgi:hypothetical protein
VVFGVMGFLKKLRSDIRVVSQKIWSVSLMSVNLMENFQKSYVEVRRNFVFFNMLWTGF